MPHLFPEIKPYHIEKLNVGHGQQIYIELTGNPKGIPVLFIHGGPGAGLSVNYQRFFDPERFLIIGFDQRGCGKSEPFADISANTTEHLIEDIEHIRQYLGISTWLLFGGSWGSSLALLVAIKYPKTIRALILRGIFLARQQDTDWFLSPDGGPANLFPDSYKNFYQYAGGELTGQAICNAYYAIFEQADEVTQAHALNAWFGWEERISRLVTTESNRPRSAQNFNRIKSLALLECHYLKHQCFIDENYILNNVDKIAHIPTTIIHGRYDLVCKAEAAYSLHSSLPNSVLHILPEAGHSASEPGIAGALVRATQQFADFSIIKET